jgi:hypothetical protein
MDLDVYGYLIKPFERNQVLISVANALQRRHLEIVNRRNQERLQEMVARKTADLKQKTDDLKATIDQLKQSQAQALHTEKWPPSGNWPPVWRTRSTTPPVSSSATSPRFKGLSGRPGCVFEAYDRLLKSVEGCLPQRTVPAKSGNRPDSVRRLRRRSTWPS